MTRKERAIKNLKQMCSDGRYLGSGSYAPLEVLEDFEVAIKALEQEPRKRTMQLFIDNKKQKEFAHEITKKFSFEELALFMYENSCEYCQKQHNCMGNATPQDCAKNIRQKFEKAYFETGDKE